MYAILTLIRIFSIGGRCDRSHLQEASIHACIKHLTCVSDEILRPFTCIHKVLTIIIMWVGTLCSLSKNNITMKIVSPLEWKFWQHGCMISETISNPVIFRDHKSIV